MQFPKMRAVFKKLLPLGVVSGVTTTPELSVRAKAFANALECTEDWATSPCLRNDVSVRHVHSRHVFRATVGTSHSKSVLITMSGCFTLEEREYLGERIVALHDKLIDIELAQIVAEQHRDLDRCFGRYYPNEK